MEAIDTVSMRKEVVKQGWLTKLGGQRKNWKTRYFLMELYSHYIRFSYYNDESMTKCHGSFDVPFGRFAKLDASHSATTNSMLVLIATNERVYKITSNSEEEITSWAWSIETSMNAIRKLLFPTLTPIRHSGVLAVKGKKIKTAFSKHECTLVDRILIIHPLRDDKADSIFIAVDQALGVRAEDKPKPRNIFVITVHKNEYAFQAMNAHDRDSWIEILGQAGCEVRRDRSTFYGRNSIISTSDDARHSTSVFSTSEQQPQDNSEDKDSLVESAPQVLKPGRLPDFEAFRDFYELHQAFKPP